MGSLNLLSCTFRFSNERSLSTPAKVLSLFDFSLSVVMAGKGDLDKDCSDPIMQFDRSSEVSLVREARLSGISVKRLEDRLNDLRLVATGLRLSTGRDVSELSASDKYLSRCHFMDVSALVANRFDELSLRCGTEYSVDVEPPDPVRLTWVE